MPPSVLTGALVEIRPREGGGATLDVVEPASGSVAGSVRMRDAAAASPRAVELVFSIYADYQRRGFGTEAVALVAAQALADGVERVQIECAVDDIASAKTALNAGFRYEGTRRSALQGKEQPVDAAVFGRVAGDPPGAIRRSFAPMPPDGLSDGVVRLRPLHGGDAEGYLEQEVDPVTVAFGFTGEQPSRQSVQATCTRAPLDWLVGSAARMALEDVETGRFAGSLTLRHPGPPGVGGVGYAVHPAFRGRGFTARALRLLVHWSFESAGFARLELGAKTDNVASQRVAVAGGFEPDGVRAARLRNADGSYSDEVRFAAVNPQTARRISP